jgi:predicted secreted protein
MATITGNDGAVTVGSTAVAAVRSFSVEMTADTIEKSVMGNDNRQYLKGMSSFSGSADIYFDPEEFDGAESTFNPTTGGATSVGSAPIAVKFYVKQDASNDIVFSGNVIVTGYTVSSSFDGMVEASISFQGTDAVALTTTGNV